MIHTLLICCQLMLVVQPGVASAPVMRSSDGGRTWVSDGTGLPEGVIIRQLVAFGAGLVAGTEGHGVWIKTGTRWTPIGQGLPVPKVTALYVTGDTIMAGLFEGGLYMLRYPGRSWVSLGAGLPDQRVRAIGVMSDGSILAGTDTGVFRRRRGWQRVAGGQQVNSLLMLRDTWYAGVVGGVLVSRDRGDTWDWAYKGATPHTLVNISNRPAACMLEGSLYRESATGWARSLIFTHSDYSRYVPTRPLEPVRMFAIVKSGSQYWMSHSDGIYLSEDQGNTWTKVAPPQGLSLMVAAGSALYAVVLPPGC